jgi:Domain of unknown function (DUF1996)/Carbohydrate binding module (family 6)
VPDGFGSPAVRSLGLVAGALAAVLIVALAVSGTASSLALANTADESTPVAVPQNAIKASSFAAQSGVQVETTTDVGGGQDVGWLANGDWMRYDGVDLGPAGALTTSIRVAASLDDQNPRPGTVEVRIDAQTGPLVAAIPIESTGGWQSWVTKADIRASTGGRHTVFLVMVSPQGRDFVNINWFSFSAQATGSPTSPAPTGTGVPSTTGPSVPSTSMPGMTMPATGMPAPTGSWVDVDQARWQAQLAAFRAMPARPIPAGARKNPEFNATCTYSHSAADDPIVFPAAKGASHLHSFIGNAGTDANTTTESLLKFTASSCKPLEDHSAYWIPSLKENGNWVEPDQVVVYYGSLEADPSKTVPLPQGLRMIAGDAKLQVATPKGAVNQFYCAGGPQDGKERSTDGNWPVCDGGTLHFTLRFPDCWDGKHLDSPTHKGHVAFGYAGTCPEAFPVPIPAVTFSIAYPTSGTTAGFMLSSGMASSMHGDAFFAWDDDALGHRVKDCVVQSTPCNTAGEF